MMKQYRYGSADLDWKRLPLGYVNNKPLGGCLNNGVLDAEVIDRELRLKGELTNE
jgi:hypothetical protein